MGVTKALWKPRELDEERKETNSAQESIALYSFTTVKARSKKSSPWL